MEYIIGALYSEQLLKQRYEHKQISDFIMFDIGGTRMWTKKIKPTEVFPVHVVQILYGQIPDPSTPMFHSVIDEKGAKLEDRL